MAFSRGNGRTKFDEIVSPHLEDAFGLALWICGNRADAEDVVQEACLRAFRAIDNYNGGSSRAWLLTIVRRMAYTWLDRNRIPGHIALADLSGRPV
jgi:RNA polymerase sigma-70 factor (ECF subfamily)